MLAASEASRHGSIVLLYTCSHYDLLQTPLSLEVESDNLNGFSRVQRAGVVGITTQFGLFWNDQERRCMGMPTTEQSRRAEAPLTTFFISQRDQTKLIMIELTAAPRSWSVRRTASG